MTVAVPLAAIEQLREHQTQIDADGTLCGVSRQALDEVLAFAERFEPQPVPGLKLETVLAGEQRELRVETDLAFDLVRIGHDVFVPEEPHVVFDGEPTGRLEEAPLDEVIHVAGNGSELTVGGVIEVARELEQMRDEEDEELFPENRAVLSDGARLIRFLGEVVLADARGGEGYGEGHVARPSTFALDPGLGRMAGADLSGKGAGA